MPQLVCAHCQRSGNVPEEYLGRVIRCKHCGQKMEAVASEERAQEEVADLASVARTERVVADRITCAACGFRQLVEAGHEAVPCPKCAALSLRAAAPREAEIGEAVPIEMRHATGSRSLVRISAHIVSWPARCACCMGPHDRTVEITAKRENSVGVTDLKTWQVPYCESCEKHAGLYRQVGDVSSGLLILIGGIAASALANGVFAVALHSNGSNDLMTLPVVLFLLWSGVAFAAYCSRPGAFRRPGRARADLEAELSGFLKASCCCRGLAADYLGWQGTVHTFGFRNEEYARRFIEANRGKVLL